MVIIFNGDTLDLLKRLMQYSDRDQKLTLDFMMRNFKIMEEETLLGEATKSYHDVTEYYKDDEEDVHKNP